MMTGTGRRAENMRNKTRSECVYYRTSQAVSVLYDSDLLSAIIKDYYTWTNIKDENA